MQAECNNPAATFLTYTHRNSEPKQSNQLCVNSRMIYHLGAISSIHHVVTKGNITINYLNPLKFLDKPWCIFTAVRKINAINPKLTGKKRKLRLIILIKFKILINYPNKVVVVVE